MTSTIYPQDIEGYRAALAAECGQLAAEATKITTREAASRFIQTHSKRIWGSDRTWWLGGPAWLIAARDAIDAKGSISAMEIAGTGARAAYDAFTA